MEPSQWQESVWSLGLAPGWSVSHHVCAGNQAQAFCKSSSAVSICAIAPASRPFSSNVLICVTRASELRTGFPLQLQLLQVPQGPRWGLVMTPTIPLSLTTCSSHATATPLRWQVLQDSVSQRGKLRHVNKETCVEVTAVVGVCWQRFTEKLHLKATVLGKGLTR